MSWERCRFLAFCGATCQWPCRMRVTRITGALRPFRLSLVHSTRLGGPAVCAIDLSMRPHDARLSWSQHADYDGSDRVCNRLLGVTPVAQAFLWTQTVWQ